MIQLQHNSAVSDDIVALTAAPVSMSEEKKQEHADEQEEELSIKLADKEAEKASPEILNTSMMVDGKMDNSSVIIIEGPSTAMAHQQDVSSMLEPEISLLPEAKIDELPSSGKK